MREDRSRPSRTGTFGEKDLGEDYLFYDGNGDLLHVLNGTARAIYLLCDGTLSPAEIATSITERYAVDTATARRDVEDALRQLEELGLVLSS